jgi:hypothetical protein
MMEFHTMVEVSDPQVHRCHELPHHIGVPIELAYAVALDGEDMPRRLRERFI